MPVTIQGIVLKSITIGKDNEGKQKIEGNYEILSSNDTVMAKDTFNGYSDIKITFSAETLAALNTFLAGAKKELSITVLGE